MYYPCSENKGADQLCSNCTTDLRLCFRIGNNPVFSRRGSYVCICENKAADQLYSDCIADHCLCFRYTNSTIPLHCNSSVTVQLGFRQTWLEIPKTGFLLSWLIYTCVQYFNSRSDTKRLAQLLKLAKVFGNKQFLAHLSRRLTR